MELQNNDTTNRPGCARPLRGCAILIMLVLVGMVALIIYLGNMPRTKDWVTCYGNMEQVGAALGRYHDVKDNYPSDLSELKKEYLGNTRVLYCPLDHSRKSISSYAYHRPKPSSSADFVVAECHRHEMFKGVPIVLRLHKSGKVTVTNVVVQTNKLKAEDKKK